MRSFRTTFAAALLGTAVLSGCNAFEGLYDVSASTDPVVLNASAQAALQQGDTQKAVDLFKRAFDAAPAGSPEKSRAANGFATASFSQSGVSALLIDRLATDLMGRFTNGSTPQNTFPTGVCSFSLPDRVGEQIQLTAIDGYPLFRAAVPVIAATRQTLAATYGLPANPGPSYNTALIVSQMRTNGFSDSDVADALLNLTIAYTATAFDRIATAGGDQIRWYEVLPSSGGASYLGYCAPSLAVEQEVKRQTSCSLGDIGFSVALLKERARLFPGGSFSGDLVAEAERAYQRLSDELGTAC